ncbi:MAG: ATP-binding protein [Planctomycetota bacterium]|jgi:uncharacterized protein YhaN
MTIRIDRIKVNRNGPLNNDFECEPGDLNLIYGHNETGKTYIVESIINLLFKTKKSSISWNLREWDLSGSIVVSGIGDQPPKNFTKTGDKLEDCWEEEIGFPRDLSRLLVVKGGETLLSKENDGIGRDILKDTLSGIGKLDQIEKRIPETLRDAKVQDKQITVKSQLKIIKERTKHKEKLKRIEDLLKTIEEDYASGEIDDLKKKKEFLKDKISLMEKAKRYHAFQLDKEIQGLMSEKGTQPDETSLSDLNSDIKLYNIKRTDFERKNNIYKELNSSNENFRWANNALESYQEIISGHTVSSYKQVFLYSVLICLFGALITGIFGLKIPVALFVLGAAGSFALFYRETRKEFSDTGQNKELEKLKIEFKNRFDSKLTDVATLKSEIEKLNEDYIRATTLKNELDQLASEIHSLESKITETLKSYTDIEQSQEQWKDSIAQIKNDIRELDDIIRSKENKLLSLTVLESDYLEQDQGVEWDNDLFNTLNNNLDEIDEAYQAELNNLDMLKNRISQETGSESIDWDDLIFDLRTKYEDLTSEYKSLTAETLAKIQVNFIVQEFRKDEDARISEGLKRSELVQPLYDLTGRYNKIRHDDDKGLVLGTDQDEEYFLNSLSTGAQEQVFLALRMGFASITMKGQPAFLILDDAFQHSDWLRRENMVNQLQNLVNMGWQIFYFTMDDHIRDLFQKAGSKLGDRFKTLQL